MSIRATTGHYHPPSAYRPTSIKESKQGKKGDDSETTHKLVHISGMLSLLYFANTLMHGDPALYGKKCMADRFRNHLMKVDEIHSANK